MTFIAQNDPLTGKPYGIPMGENERIISKTDSVVDSIIDQFVERARFGKAKYGTDLDREDLNTLEWIEHAKQEHMDAILYLEKLKKIIETKPL
jgi:hypothetical protein